MLHFTPVRPRTLLAILAISALASALPGRATATEGEFPKETRLSIEDALHGRISSLVGAKNDEGAVYQRGSFSKNFRKVDDSTAEVSFNKETSDKESVLTERFLYTLKKDGSKWKIANEDLKDSVRLLYRLNYSKPEYQSFESFSFSNGGFKASAGKGTLWKLSREGKVERLFLAGAGLAYEISPAMDKEKALYAKLKRDHPDDVLFNPDYAVLDCDGATCERLLSTCFTGLATASESQLTPELRAVKDKTLRDYNKDAKNDAFYAMRPLYETDQRAYQLSLRNAGETKGVAWNFDNYDGREMSYWVYGLFETFPSWDKVYAWYSEETANSGVPAIDLERRDSGTARDYDLTGLVGTVDLALDDPEQLKGDITFSLIAKRDLKKVNFQISRINDETSEKRESKNPRMTINSIEDGEGNELTWVKTGSTSGSVVFPETIATGKPFKVRMGFENKDSIININPTYSYVDRGGWLPFVNFGDKIATFDLTFRVPQRYKTLGIGKLISEEVKDGQRISRFQPEAQVDFPTVIFGDYYSAKSAIEVKKADGTVVPVTVFLDKTGMSEWGLAPKSMMPLADEAANALNLYSQIYGVEYLYSKLDLVNDPLGFLYGQAPASIIYLGSGAFFSKGKLGSGGGGDLTKFTKSLVAHETGHQWWGSAIGNANERNYWFIESLAELSSSIFVERVHSHKEYLDHVSDWRREILDSDLQTSVQDASDLWTGGFRGYRAAVYSKGPYAFYMMRNTWGDEKFFAFLKMLATELNGKEIVTRDIQKVAEKAFGGNMEWFFDQWIRGIGIPEYTVSYTKRQSEDGKWLVEGKIDQRLLIGNKQKNEVIPGQYFTAIVPFTVTGADGKEYRVPLKVEGPSTPFKFKTASQPSAVEFNKFGEVLAWDIINKS